MRQKKIWYFSIPSSPLPPLLSGTSLRGVNLNSFAINSMWCVSVLQLLSPLAKNSLFCSAVAMPRSWCTQGRDHIGWECHRLLLQALTVVLAGVPLEDILSLVHSCRGSKWVEPEIPFRSSWFQNCTRLAPHLLGVLHWLDGWKGGRWHSPWQAFLKWPSSNKLRE